MKEWIDCLNDYAGLFSLLAVIAAIFVPFIIYLLQRKAQKRAMKDELETMDRISSFPMDSESRKYYIRRNTLEKGLNR